MLTKVRDSCAAALAGIHDGATILVSGFGGSGVPYSLVTAVAATGVSGLTVVSNNAGIGDAGLPELFRNGQVAKLICSFPRSSDTRWFDQRFLAGELALELVPQGTLAERIRAGGAGIPAFYTPSGIGTEFAAGKEVRVIDGREYVLEHALRADYALIRAAKADVWGNAVYRKSSRNFAPPMATAAKITVAEVDEIVRLGEIDPEHVVTPGIYIDRVVLNEQ